MDRFLKSQRGGESTFTGKRNLFVYVAAAALGLFILVVYMMTRKQEIPLDPSIVAADKAASEAQKATLAAKAAVAASDAAQARLVDANANVEVARTAEQIAADNKAMAEKALSDEQAKATAAQQASYQAYMDAQAAAQQKAQLEAAAQLASQKAFSSQLAAQQEMARQLEAQRAAEAQAAELAKAQLAEEQAAAARALIDEQLRQAAILKQQAEEQARYAADQAAAAAAQVEAAKQAAAEQAIADQKALEQAYAQQQAEAAAKAAAAALQTEIERQMAAAAALAYAAKLAAEAQAAATKAAADAAALKMAQAEALAAAEKAVAEATIVMERLVKYVRFENPVNYVQLAEVKFYTPDGAPIPASNITYTTSGSLAVAGKTYGPELALDSDTDGYFTHGSIYISSGSSNQWVQYEFKEPMDVGVVKIWGRTDCCNERMDTTSMIMLNSDQVPLTKQDLTSEVQQTYMFAFSPRAQAIEVTKYDFYPTLDSPGNEIAYIPDHVDDVPNLYLECDVRPNCGGFNSNAILRQHVVTPDKMVKWTSDMTKGFYAKRSIPLGQ